MKRERQMERDRRHEQRMKHGLENEEVDHRYIKPTTNQVVITTNGHRRRGCLLYTSPSPRDKRQSRMPSSA